MWKGSEGRRPFKNGIHIWPRSLAGRTAVTLLVALAVVQALGLFIHALDRMDLQRLAQARDTGIRIASLYRSMAETPLSERDTLLKEIPSSARLGMALSAAPNVPDLGGPPFPFERLIRESMRLVPIPPPLHPRQVMMREEPWHHVLLVSLLLPGGDWLNLRIVQNPPRPWHSPTFLVAFLGMTVAAAVLILWAVRRLTAPVRTLAAAAEALGRDVNAPSLPEEGPSEIAIAGAAFNRMAENIRRFVRDRTLLLAAIGHDLRTPITRLKLRAEFIDDDELRDKFLADLNELETMVSATLAFGRDAASGEPMVPMDLPALLRTILDDAADARPDHADRLRYDGPEHMTFHARPVAMKRALSNLVANAVKYAGDATVTLVPPQAGMLTIWVEDTGPGIPPDELGQVFEPFHRVERSRNRETGGTGLGLPIARNIIRGHGGDVMLANRVDGGIKAIITLPV